MPVDRKSKPGKYRRAAEKALVLWQLADDWEAYVAAHRGSDEQDEKYAYDEQFDKVS